MFDLVSFTNTKASFIGPNVNFNVIQIQQLFDLFDGEKSII